MKLPAVGLAAALAVVCALLPAVARAATPQPPSSHALLAQASASPSLRTATATILMYHHIAVPPRALMPAAAQYFVSPASFEQQIYYLLVNGYHIVSLNAVVDALTGGDALPPKAAAITIDDGWQDFWKNGLPIVDRYAIPVTIFPIADATKDGYMDPGERWVIAHTGLQVAAHTLTHPHLTRLLPALANSEIANSKKNLEKELGLPVPLFAYPYGDLNAPIEAMVRAAGYRAAFAAGPAPDEDSQHLFQLPRVMVSHYDTLDVFGRKVADYRWARTHYVPLPVLHRAPAASADFDPDTSATRLLNDMPSDGSDGFVPPPPDAPVGPDPLLGS